MLGTIRLGNYKNTDPTVVNTDQAEQSFLAAARYAQHDAPSEAGNAFICAGRAAYLSGRSKEAIQYTEKGLGLSPSNSAGLYQLARLYCIEGRTPEAAKPLFSAIRISPDHSISAQADPEFLAKREMLEDVLRKARDLFVEEANRALSAFDQAFKRLSEFTYENVSVRRLIGDQLEELRSFGQRAQEELKTATLLGAVSAKRMALAQRAKIPKLFEEYKRHLCEFINREFQGKNSTKSVDVRNQGLGHNNPPKPRSHRFRSFIDALLLTLVAVGICFAIYAALSPTWIFRNPGNTGGFIVLILVIGAFSSPVWGVVLLVKIYQLRLDIYSDRERARQHNWQIRMAADAVEERRREQTTAAAEQHAAEMVQRTISAVSNLSCPEFWLNTQVAEVTASSPPTVWPQALSGAGMPQTPGIRRSGHRRRRRL